MNNKMKSVFGIAGAALAGVVLAAKSEKVRNGVNTVIGAGQSLVSSVISRFTGKKSEEVEGTAPVEASAPNEEGQAEEQFEEVN